MNPLSLVLAMANAHKFNGIVPPTSKINTKHYDRYAPCPCKSGKKFKWCCEKEARK